MNVIGVILGCGLLAICGFVIYRNIKGIVQKVKDRKAAKLKKDESQEEKIENDTK